MNHEQPLAPAWHPEADEAVFEEMAASLNRAFGREFFAHVEGRELVVHTGGITAWIAADGSLSGVASIGPSEE